MQLRVDDLDRIPGPSEGMLISDGDADLWVGPGVRSIVSGLTADVTMEWVPRGTDIGIVIVVGQREGPADHFHPFDVWLMRMTGEEPAQRAATSVRTTAEIGHQAL